MTWTTSDVEIVKAALMLLREDAYPAQSELENATGAVAGKVAAVYETLKNAFLESHDWNFAGAGSDLTQWTSLAKEAFTAYLARSLAVPLTGRTQDATLAEELYQSALDRAKTVDVEAKIAADEFAAELFTGVDSSGDKLARAWAAYQAAKENVFEETKEEVLAWHHWNFARKTSVFTSTAPAAMVRLLRVTDADGKELGWKISQGTITVDGGEAAYIEYTERVAESAFSPYAARALKSARKARLAAVTGNKDLQAAEEKLEAQYLLIAKAQDLNDQFDKSGIVQEVKDVLKTFYQAGDTLLEDSSGDFTGRILRILDRVRKEVLAAKAWNFTRSLRRAAPVWAGSMWRVEAPPDAVRILRCFANGGEEEAGYTRVGDAIYADGKIDTIIYTRDEKNIDRWPAAVRSCLVWAIVREAAIPSKNGDWARQSSQIDALYREKLRIAAQNEAQETHPGEEAWGENRYGRAIKGARRGQRRYGANPFDARNGEIW